MERWKVRKTPLIWNLSATFVMKRSHSGKKQQQRGLQLLLPSVLLCIAEDVADASVRDAAGDLPSLEAHGTSQLSEVDLLLFHASNWPISFGCNFFF